MEGRLDGKKEREGQGRKERVELGGRALFVTASQAPCLWTMLAVMMSLCLGTLSQGRGAGLAGGKPPRCFVGSCLSALLLLLRY